LQLTLGKHLAQSTHYLTKEDKDDWENLPEFGPTLLDWDMFKQDLFREYPNTRKPFISLANLDLSMRNPSRRSTPWMSSPCSIGSLEDCQLGWLRRKESVPTVLTGHTRRASILSFKTNSVLPLG